MLYALIGLIVGAICHWQIAGFQRAAALAAVITVATVFIGDYIWAGYLDPFWPVSLSIGLLIAISATVLAGVPFRGIRRRRINQQETRN